MGHTNRTALKASLVLLSRATSATDLSKLFT